MQDSTFESYFRYEGLRVKISDASFGNALKTDAFESVIVEALENFTRLLKEQHEH